MLIPATAVVVVPTAAFTANSDAADDAAAGTVATAGGCATNTDAGGVGVRAAATAAVVSAASADGADGADGDDSADGADGADSADSADGADGAD